MSSLVLDIETIGEKYDELDESTQESLTRWIKRESYNDEEYEVALKDLKEGLGFSPLTGRIVAIGIFDPEREKGAVYFDAPGETIQEFEENGYKFKSLDEASMLRQFWQLATKYQDFVTFNGRCFDIPFLMIRSAVNGIRPTRNLMATRYLNSSYSAFEGVRHIDLQDQLSFYGAVRRKGSLHLWCRAFNIESPKTNGVTGDDVQELYTAKKYLDIARYNALDVTATAELYTTWQKYLQF